MNRIYILIGILFVANACNTSPNKGLEFDLVTEGRSYGDCDDPNTCSSISLTYPIFSSEKDKGLQDYIYAIMFDEQEIDTVLFDFVQSIEEYGDYSEMMDANASKWYDTRIFEELYRAKEIVSFSISTDSYMGGAHGNRYVYFINVDPKTSKVLLLDELFEKNDLEELLKTTEAAFRKKYAIDPSEDFGGEGYIFDEDEFSFSEQYAFTEEGLLFFYNSYEIASYAQGTQELVIPWDNFEGKIKWKE